MNRRHRVALVSLLLVVTLFSRFGFSQPVSQMLMTTDWLGEHLKDPNVVVLDVSNDRAMRTITIGIQ